MRILEYLTVTVALAPCLHYSVGHIPRHDTAHPQFLPVSSSSYGTMRPGATIVLVVLVDPSDDERDTCPQLRQSEPNRL